MTSDLSPNPHAQDHLSMLRSLGSHDHDRVIQTKFGNARCESCGRLATAEDALRNTPCEPLEHVPARRRR